MPLDADLNTFGPVKAYSGIWSKATSTNATLEKNFPEDNAVGVLEVLLPAILQVRNALPRETAMYTCVNSPIGGMALMVRGAYGVTLNLLPAL